MGGTETCSAFQSGTFTSIPTRPKHPQWSYFRFFFFFFGLPRPFPFHRDDTWERRKSAMEREGTESIYIYIEEADVLRPFFTQRALSLSFLSLVVHAIYIDCWSDASFSLSLSQQRMPPLKVTWRRSGLPFGTLSLPSSLVLLTWNKRRCTFENGTECCRSYSLILYYLHLVILYTL